MPEKFGPGWWLKNKDEPEKQIDEEEDEEDDEYNDKNLLLEAGGLEDDKNGLGSYIEK